MLTLQTLVQTAQIRTLESAPFSSAMNFKPLHYEPFHRLFTWTIGEYIVAGFDQMGTFIQIDKQDGPKNSEIFHALWPNLTWLELARLFVLDNFLDLFDRLKIAELYQIKNTEALLTCYSRLPEFDKDLEIKFIDKKISYFDLPFLQDLGDQSLEPLWFRPLFDNSLSKSQILQAWEWAQDLILMKKNSELINALNSENPWKSIYSMRFVQTEKSRHQLETTMASNWPSSLKPRFERRGDRAGFVIESFVTNSQDLEKLSQQAKYLSEQWPSRGES